MAYTTRYNALLTQATEDTMRSVISASSYSSWHQRLCVSIVECIENANLGDPILCAISVADGVLDATDGMGWDERRNADGFSVDYGDYDYDQSRSLQMDLITGINSRLA